MKQTVQNTLFPNQAFCKTMNVMQGLFVFAIQLNLLSITKTNTNQSSQFIIY